ncbi:AAA family ATPase [Pseudonocardia saturnea]
MSPLVGRRAEHRALVAALRAGRDVLIEGPAGTGKSLLVREAAAAVGRRITTVEGSAAVTTGTLLGHHDPAAVLQTGFRAAGFVDGPLIVAMRHGRLLHVDEANRLPPDTLDLLLSPLGERRITVPRVGTIVAAPGFRVVATANDDDPSGTHPLGRALAERLVRLRVNHLPADGERAVVRGHAPDAPAWLVRAAVAVTRATRDHPDLLRGASVRGPVDLLLVARELAELEDVDLRDRGGRTLDTALRACMVALSGRVMLRESSSRSAEDVIREVWEDETALRVAAAAGGPTSVVALPSVVIHRDRRPVRAPEPGRGAETVPVALPGTGPPDPAGGAPPAAGTGPVRPTAANREGPGGADANSPPAATALTDRELDDLADIAAGPSSRATRRGTRRRLAGTDPRLVHRLAVQIIVRRARLAARGRRGTGSLRSARFRFQSDDLDLDRSIEELAADPYPRHDDFWVRERSAGRRAVVLMVDVSGSMRGAPLVRAALAAATASVVAAQDDLATVLFWSRTAVVTSIENPRPLPRVVEDVLAVRSEGLTDITLGLSTGLRRLERSRARVRVGILLTDGASNHGGDPARAARGFPRLHVLTTATTPRRMEACRRLASAGHGECVPVPAVADIPPALTRCLDGGHG